MRDDSHVECDARVANSRDLVKASKRKLTLQHSRYYQAYVTFFEDEILEKGVSNVFEQYIVSKDANLVPFAPGVEPPHMLSRYLGGFLHSQIHTGYGAEFNVLGLWAEGSVLLPVEWYLHDA